MLDFCFPYCSVEAADVILDLLGIELWRLKGVGEGRVKLKFCVLRPKGTVRDGLHNCLGFFLASSLL